MKHDLKYILSRLSQEEFSLLVKTAKRSNQLFGKSIKKLIYYPYKLVKIEFPDWFYNAEFNPIIKRFFKVSLEEITRGTARKITLVYSLDKRRTRGDLPTRKKLSNPNTRYGFGKGWRIGTRPVR